MNKEELKRAVYELEQYQANLEKQIVGGEDTLVQTKTALDRIKFIKLINEESLAVFRKQLTK